MFVKRVISGVLLLAAVVLTDYVGGRLLWAVMAFLSVIGLFELYRATGLKDKKALVCPGYVGAVIYNVALTGLLPVDFDALMFVIIMFFLACLAIFVILYPKYHASDVFIAFFGLVYVPVMLGFVTLTRELPYGSWLVGLIYIASWGSDTCAYCVGMLFNKFLTTHRLAPVLSPKKSIEGSIGGIVGAAALGALFGLEGVHFAGADSFVIPGFALIGGVGSVISQIGDLAASGIKRNYDIKDYGRMIPGHGGVLDRFDSVIITAPLIYYLSMLIL